MTLDVNKEELTILGIPFDNFSDFDTVWYAIGSSMIENYEPTVQDVIDLKLMLSTNERNWILVKNQYEGYEYIDPNHQYTYPNSTVLINKQNITNIEEAYRNEHLFVTRRLADLRLKTIEVYSISDILAIHKYLFQDVYAWAGHFARWISQKWESFNVNTIFSTAKYI